jgi:DNA-binding MarR family transcriptional regulator
MAEHASEAILLAIARESEANPDQGYAAADINRVRSLVASASVSRSVRRLEQRGLVRVERLDHWKRENWFRGDPASLTVSGVALLAGLEGDVS